MSQKNKTWRVMAALGLLLWAVPAALQAQYNYTTNADGISITITGYTGSGGTVTMPTNINGLTVNNIAPGAFQNCYVLTNLTIADTVTNIGENAFRACANLIGATIPGSVAVIGEKAFWQCIDLSQLTLGNGIDNIVGEAFVQDTLLTNVIIPISVTNIGKGAFTYTGSVTMPGTVGTAYTSDTQSTGGAFDLAFYGAEVGVTNVTIDNGVTQISTYLFDGAFVTKVTLPASLTSIGMDAFYECPNLKTLTIPANVTNLGENALYIGVLTNVFFEGNAPAAALPQFVLPTNPIVYYMPGTTGWSNTFAGNPTRLWNPAIQTGGPGFGVQGSQFGFNITGTTNIPIVVEACGNLTSPVWTRVAAATLTNGSYQFSEPWQSNSAARFYRITSP